MSSLNKLYNIIWGQCSEQLQATVKFLDDYDTKEEGRDIVWLLTQLQRETAGIDSLGNRHITLIKTLRTLINMRQGADEIDDGYLKRMKANAESLKLAGGRHVMISSNLITKAGTKATTQEENVELDKFLAALFLSNADPRRYAELNKELLHSAQLGNDQYPTMSSAAYELMCRRSGRYEHRSRSNNSRDNSRHGGRLQFLQRGNNTNAKSDGEDLTPGKDGTEINVECYRCHKRGHYAVNCPQGGKRVSVQVSNGVSLT